MDIVFLEVKILDENTWESRFYFLIIGQVYWRCYLLPRNFGKFVSSGTQSSRKRKNREHLAQEAMWNIPLGEEFFFVSFGQNNKKADEVCIQCKHVSSSSLQTGIPSCAVWIAATFCVLFDIIQFLLNKNHLDKLVPAHFLHAFNDL